MEWDEVVYGVGVVKCGIGRERPRQKMEGGGGGVKQGRGKAKVQGGREAKTTVVVYDQNKVRSM